MFHILIAKFLLGKVQCKSLFLLGVVSLSRFGSAVILWFCVLLRGEEEKLADIMG